MESGEKSAQVAVTLHAAEALLGSEDAQATQRLSFGAAATTECPEHGKTVYGTDPLRTAAVLQIQLARDRWSRVAAGLAGTPRPPDFSRHMNEL
jgi:hypothetical protein